MSVVTSSGASSRLVAVLRLRDFRLLWLTSAAWYAARWIDTVTTGWLALALTDSPVFLALIGACRTLPLLLLGIAGGILAGRVPRRSVLMGAIVSGILISAWLVGAAALNAIQPWQLVVTTLATNSLWALSFPSQRSLIAETTAGRAALANALALDNFVFVGANFVFSALAGAIIPLAGPQGAYLLALGAFLLALPLIVALRQPPAAVSEYESRAGDAGYRAVISRPAIGGVLAISVAMNGLALPLIQFLPLVAKEVLRVGPAELGLLVSGWGGGSLLGNVVLFVLSPRRSGLLFAAGSFGAALGLFLFSLANVFPLAMLLIFASGMLMSFFGTFQSTVLIEAAGPAGRAKALGALTVAIGVQPFGVLALGWLAGTLGAAAAIGIAAAVATVVIGVVAALFPGLVRHRSRLAA
ncbi:MAG: MFS transporter [Chloroflexota bacterium]|nr:MFS transporter [Dehalococcoidia bacterium]MDW8254595.1 MFS transporter [Chloroflexota bacterium]